MSDNGPHMQPPHPGSGGDPNNPSGPYGEYYGQGSGPQFGGQPPYGPDPYSGGQPPYGGQPPGGPQYPPPQDPAMMHAGGAGYGSGGYPSAPQPPQRSNLGLYIVIGGGAIIVVLVVVVLVMLLRGGDEPSEVAAPPPETEPADDDGGDVDEPDDTKDEEPIETEVGEPPHALPEDQCAGVEEDRLESLEANQSSTSSTDNTARCRWDIVLETGEDAQLELNYQLPYTASDSVEGAIDLFERELEWATDEDGDIIETTVHENNEIDLADQANLVFATQDSTLGDVSVATMLVRQDNLVITAEVRAYPDWINDEEEAPLSYGDISDLMPELGASAVNNLG
jgi:cell division septation protein DedD